MCISWWCMINSLFILPASVLFSPGTLKIRIVRRRHGSLVCVWCWGISTLGLLLRWVLRARMLSIVRKLIVIICRSTGIAVMVLVPDEGNEKFQDQIKHTNYGAKDKVLCNVSDHYKVQKYTKEVEANKRNKHRVILFFTLTNSVYTKKCRRKCPGMCTNCKPC